MSLDSHEAEMRGIQSLQDLLKSTGTRTVEEAIKIAMSRAAAPQGDEEVSK